MLTGDERGPDRRDRSVRAGLKHLSTELSSAQVGITLTTILLGYTAQPALLSLFGEALSSTPLGRAASATGVSPVTACARCGADRCASAPSSSPSR